MCHKSCINFLVLLLILVVAEVAMSQSPLKNQLLSETCFNCTDFAIPNFKDTINAKILFENDSIKKFSYSTRYFNYFGELKYGMPYGLWKAYYPNGSIYFILQLDSNFYSNTKSNFISRTHQFNHISRFQKFYVNGQIQELYLYEKDTTKYIWFNKNGSLNKQYLYTKNASITYTYNSCNWLASKVTTKKFFYEGISYSRNGLIEQKYIRFEKKKKVKQIQLFYNDHGKIIERKRTVKKNKYN